MSKAIGENTMGNCAVNVDAGDRRQPELPRGMRGMGGHSVGCAIFHHRQKDGKYIRTWEDSASVDRLVGLCHIRPIPERLITGSF